MDRPARPRLAAVMAFARRRSEVTSGLGCVACGRPSSECGPCGRCARAVVHFGADPEMLVAAAEYLERTAVQPALGDRFSFTEAEWEDVYAHQAGRCAICSAVRARSLVTDHDTAAGTVRGLLCGKCRWGIALLEHDPRRARALAASMELADASRRE